MPTLSRTGAQFNPEPPKPSKSVYLRAGGRVVAEVTPAGILDRRRWVVLRRPTPSIGYSASLLREAVDIGATVARNRDESTGLAYVAPVERIFELGFQKEFAGDVQIFLPVVHWDKVRADGSVVAAAAQPVTRPAQTQLSLFEVS